MSNGRLSYNDDDIKGDITPKKLKLGAYKFRVTKVAAKINEKSGNIQKNLTCAPVDANDDTKKPTAFLALTYPWKTPADRLAEAGLPPEVQKKVPNTMFVMVGYATHRFNAKSPFPITPVQKVKKIGAGYVEVDDLGNPTGNPAQSKEENEKARDQQARDVRDFLIEADANPDILVGDEFYGMLTWDEERELQSLEVVSKAEAEAAGMVDMSTGDFTE